MNNGDYIRYLKHTVENTNCIPLNSKPILVKGRSFSDTILELLQKQEINQPNHSL